MELILAVMAAAALFSLVVVLRVGVLAYRAARTGRLERPGVLDLALLAVAVCGLLVYAYGRWVEPRWVEVRHVVVRRAELGEGESLRVVHLSDLHSPSNPGLERRLPGLVERLEPDVIVFTGDAVNHPGALPRVTALFGRLAEIAPTYVIRGNRDYALGDRSLVAGTDAVELRGRAETLEPGGPDGVRVALIGPSRPGDWSRVYGELRKQPAETLVLFLSHSPDVADDIARWGADIAFAGHTHGGQVAVPRHGALWTGSRFGKRFEAGLYRVDDMSLYINRGIGFQASLPKIRVGARPEVTLLEVLPLPAGPEGRSGGG